MTSERNNNSAPAALVVQPSCAAILASFCSTLRAMSRPPTAEWLILGPFQAIYLADFVEWLVMKSKVTPAAVVAGVVLLSRLGPGAVVSTGRSNPAAARRSVAGDDAMSDADDDSEDDSAEFWSPVANPLDGLGCGFQTVCPHSLAVVALHLSVKLFDANAPSLQEWAELSSLFTFEGLTALENEMVSALGGKIAVSTEEFTLFLSHIAAHFGSVEEERAATAAAAAAAAKVAANRAAAAIARGYRTPATTASSTTAATTTTLGSPARRSSTLSVESAPASTTAGSAAVAAAAAAAANASYAPAGSLYHNGQGVNASTTTTTATVAATTVADTEMGCVGDTEMTDASCAATAVPAATSAGHYNVNVDYDPAYSRKAYGGNVPPSSPTKAVAPGSATTTAVRGANDRRRHSYDLYASPQANGNRAGV